MENIREQIYLAALLHDIGKFYQRADSGSVQKNQFLINGYKEESTFCPSQNGIYSHKHVLWTAQFIDDNRTIFQRLIGDRSGDLTSNNSLIYLAAGHHLLTDQLSEYGKIIKEADCLSSGIERNSDKDLDDCQDEKEWDMFRKKQMIPILQTINCINKEISWFRVPINSLSLRKETAFPRSAEAFEGKQPDYNSLWKDFTNEFRLVQANTYRAFSETLLNLLHKYASCIPASTVDFPDVSLFDHLKTTAALSLCLFDVQKSGENPEDTFLLIGADFSGIQTYIYQIVSKYAGKNLKGRSFYLHILSDAIVRFLLKRLDLFQANVIYNSGGGFYILAPNTSEVKKKLNESIEEIERKLFEAHGTSLFAAIDSIGISKDVLLHRNNKSLRKVWDELHSKQDIKKSQKFSRLIKNSYDTFFSPEKTSDTIKFDLTTGEEFLSNEKSEESEYNGKSLLIKKITGDQIKLGQKLRETEVMVVSEEDISCWENETHVEPIKLGLHYYFLKSRDISIRKELLRTSADRVSVITLNGRDKNCDFMGTIDRVNNIYGLEFYGGNEFNGNTFEKICENPKFSRLGVLRMDVDNLGSIFQLGIPEEKATLSRFAALSRSLDYFFSGYLNTIWKEEGESDSFIIYSGGDDLFIIGSWDTTIKIAKRIREDFRNYSCNNPSFSISGGIAIIPPKYPITKGAEIAGKEEENAKNHQCKEADKNSISFMGMPLNWDKEFPIVEQLKDKIFKLVAEEKHLPKSFISKILSHLENARVKNHKITALKTFWMIAYDLGRMCERVKNAETKDLINRCKTEICENGDFLNGKPINSEYHPLELWAFACRWAELETRSNEIKQ